jgi:flagellar hook assembly protein FlgD
LRVYDLKGRLVRELESGQRGVGVHEVTWDGTDASSRAAASGVYLAEVVVDGERRSTRLTLVR